MNSKMSTADKRYTAIIEDARLLRIPPDKANQIFVKVYLEGTGKGKETKAASHNGERFVFNNETAEIEVDSRSSAPTVLIVKVMQSGLLKSSRVGKLKVTLPKQIPLGRITVKPDELKDRHGHVVGNITVHLVLKSATGNFMAIERRTPIPTTVPETEPLAARMLNCDTFTSLASTGAPSEGGSSRSSVTIGSAASHHALVIGQHPQRLMHEATYAQQPRRREMAGRSPLREGRSMPAPVRVSRPSMGTPEAMGGQMPLDRNITHNSNDTMSSMRSAHSRASISHFSVQSDDDYPLSPAADPPRYGVPRTIELNQIPDGQPLAGSLSLPTDITAVPLDRFPVINNLPDEPSSDASVYNSRFPNMDA